VKARQLERLLDRHHKLGSKRIAARYNATHARHISPWLVRHYSSSFDFEWKKPQKKPRLLPRHRAARLAWALAHVDTDFSSWLFSDEKTFQLGPSGSAQRIRKGEQVVVETVKHPPKLNCWFGVGRDVKMEPYLFKQNMTADLYCTILSSRLSTPMEGTLPDDFTFQQDGDSKHTAKVTQRYLNKNVPHWTSDWPAQSPDLNITENCWTHITRSVDEQAPTTLAGLEKAIKRACKDLPMSTINACVDSMGARCRAVIKADGGHTRY
jgi:ketohexokinase/beta-glucosidase